MTVKTGFIGIGAMGDPMARMLIAAGIPLVVHDIDLDKCRRLADLGAEIAASPAAVARAAKRILCMVDTTAQVRAVMTGASGVMETARAGHQIACMSTIAPAEIRALHEELADSGVSFIDAPVSGGVERARAGTLAVFIGGDAAAQAPFQDAFEAMCDHLFTTGEVGCGMALKLVNNMLVQVNSVAVAEAMMLGTRAGLDPQLIHDAIKVSTGYSVAFEMRVPRMIARNFAPGGRMDISYKDQELETAFAKKLGVPMLLAAVTQQVYQIARNMGLSGEDASALIKVYEQLGGAQQT